MKAKVQEGKRKHYIFPGCELYRYKAW